MENRFFTIESPKNNKISIQVACGHFTTGRLHISHYIDISELKSCASMARNAAKELAAPYLGSAAVDVVVYMEGTEILAAYLADELLQAGPGVINSGAEIHVITPIISAEGNFVFHQNVKNKIYNKNVVLLVSTTFSGENIKRMLECLSYYGCKVVGISTIFCATKEVDGHKINTLFTNDEIPDYHWYILSECEMCKKGRGLDALISSEGYTQL